MLLTQTISRRAFTLVELLVVIAIIGILMPWPCQLFNPYVKQVVARIALTISRI